MVPSIFIKHLLRDIDARQIVYFIYPVLYGIAVLSLVYNSWLFFIIVSVSFYFSMDAVLVQSKNRFLDISKFYFIAKPLDRLFLDYLFYRLKISFIFSYLPSFVIGIFFFSDIAPKLHFISEKEAYLYYLLYATLSWIFYILISTPMLSASFRSKSAIEVFKAPGYLFYFSFLITQLKSIKLPVSFSSIVALYVIILLIIIIIGYYFLFKFIREERIFP